MKLIKSIKTGRYTNSLVKFEDINECARAYLDSKKSLGWYAIFSQEEDLCRGTTSSICYSSNSKKECLKKLKDISK